MEEIEIKTRESEPEPVKLEDFNWIIPICCREGLDSCTHVVNKEFKRRKVNVGM